MESWRVYAQFPAFCWSGFIGRDGREVDNVMVGGTYYGTIRRKERDGMRER